MPDWIHNPHADFVLAAYAAAAAALIGLAALSVRAHRARAKEWREMAQDPEQ